MLNMFITKVTTNSIAPTAKSVLYSMLPVRHVADPHLGDEGGHRLDRAASGLSVRPRLLPGGDRHDHRLADRAGDPEHERGDDAGQRGGDHHPRRDLQLRGAQCVGALRAATCGTADIASSESEATVGTIMKPITSPAARDVEDLDARAEVLQERGDGR